MIIYFSATGNSKYVAQEIAKATGDDIVSILEVEDEIHLNEYEKLGIVTPTYHWGLPSVVNDFLNKVRITGAQKSYIYYIATYGTTTGQTGAFVQQHLAKKRLKVDAFYSVKMPDTWTPTFDLSDAKKVSLINWKEVPQINEIIKHIMNNDSGDYMKAKVPMFAVKLYYPTYESPDRLRICM